MFYGMQMGYYLMINSSIVFIAVFATLVKKYSSGKMRFSFKD
jgi:hypothetical protein